jgi:hypothetical protein
MAYQDYYTGNYRLAVGWINSVLLTSDYNVTAFPKQTDQGRAKWVNPSNENGWYNDGQETIIALGGNAIRDGQANFEWEFKGLLPQMLNYWQYTLFNGQASEQFTIMTWDRQGRWQTVWAWGYWRTPKEFADGTWRRGFNNVIVPFTVDQTAPVAPDVSPLSDHGTDPQTASVNFAYTMNAENNGDGATHDDTVIQIDLPASFEYVSTVGASYTIEYFESGAWVSSVGTPANVTALRATYTSVIPAGQASPDWVVTVNPTMTGTYQVDITTTTADDSNTGNDTINDETDVT